MIGLLGVVAGRDRGAIGTQPPVFDQQHFVAIDGDRFAFRTTNARASDGSDPKSPSSRRSQSIVPAWRIGMTNVSLAPGANGDRAVNGSIAGSAVEAMPVRHHRHRQFIASVTSTSSPRLKCMGVSGAAASDHTGVSCCPGRNEATPALACSVSFGRLWATAKGDRTGSRSRRQGRLRRPRRVRGRADWSLHDAEHLLVTCPLAGACDIRRQRAIFLLRTGEPHVISPPPATPRPNMMLLAGVAELVDALDLGSSDESCGGSSPSARTRR